MHSVVKTSAALAALALLGGSALAQTPAAAPPPAKKGLFSKFFHPKPKPGTMSPMHSGMMSPMHSGMMSHSSLPMSNRSVLGGQFIGNKNSHVFHAPGDKGALPSEKNRVYFPSAAAAEAAGYHASGRGPGVSAKHSMKHSSTAAH